MSLRKKLAAAMLAEAYSRPNCTPEAQARIECIGGALSAEARANLETRRAYFRKYTDRAKKLAAAYDALPKDFDPDALPPPLRVLHEAVAGDDGIAYLAVKELEEAEADAVIFAVGAWANWERERVLGFLFDLAEERSSPVMRRHLALLALSDGMYDGSRVLARVETLLGRPLTNEEWHDWVLDSATQGIFEPLEGFPNGSEIIRTVLARGAGSAIIRLLARRLLEWDDERSDEPFIEVVRRIRD